MIVCGFDTSNYTTSVSLFDTQTGVMEMEKKLLPVREKACGLRQSDAVFLHVKQLGELAQTLSARTGKRPDAVGVSTRPRPAEGSYMPCFLVGKMTATVLSGALSVPLVECSHQEGHLAAALFSAGRLDLLDAHCLAFHVSGGTTEALLASPGEDAMDLRLVARTLDLHAGQVIDRVGVQLGLSFPCGPALEALAESCPERIKVHPTLKGADCCLSGLQNQCEQKKREGKSDAWIAKFCLLTVQETISAMTQRLLAQYGDLPVVYAGGVMSNRMMQQALAARFHASFAEPRYSADNSAGVAVLCARKLGAL